MEKFIQVGQIVGAFGLKGQVKIRPMTDFLDRFQKGSRLRMNGDWVEIETYSLHKERPLVKLRGVDTIDAAEALQWAYLEAEALTGEDMDDDEFLTEDLIGLRVVTVEGQELGVVDQVMPMPAHDVIVVGALMIPAVAEFVTDIDLEARTMTVKLIPGMIED